MPPSHRQLLAAADQSERMFLPRIEAGWIGNAVALLGLALGVPWANSNPAGDGGALGWAALALVVVGMVIQMTWRQMDDGWHIDFARRRIAPQGAIGDPLDLADAEPPDSSLAVGGYTIVCSPGDKWRSLVIDLRHNERGRVARLFQSAGPARRADRRALSALADVLARRLQVGRAGMTF